MIKRPRTILCDIDGVIFKHKGDICKQHLDDPVVLDGVKEKIREWDLEGCHIILITGRRESVRKDTEKQLSNAGIIYDDLVMNVSGGMRVLINDKKQNKNDTTAIAICVDRNKGIKNILNNKQENTALCILAAGRGSRLKHFSEHINKCLLPINNKAVISNIIDKVPNDYDIIIAVGYKSGLIKEYCSAAYPNRNIIFVDVDNIDGEDSGPGYSLMCCKEYLQRSFYLVVADCLFKNALPPLDSNWLGVYPTSTPDVYSTADIDENMVITSFKNKSKDGFDYAFVGLCGILDFKIFWDELEKNINNTGELVSAFFNVEAYNSMEARLIEWYDAGTVDKYIKTKIELNNEKYGMPKTNSEFLYKVNNIFIKILVSSELTKNKIVRAKILEGLVPPLIYKGKNTFSYKWVDGYTLYETKDESVWIKFIDWCSNNLWKRDDYNIKDDCFYFYKNKTLNRLDAFLNKKDETYKNSYIINGKKCGTVFEYLDKIDWDYICDGISTRLFHGDLQFDNVVYDGKGFMLIDWRDSFGKSNTNGDVYYDLSKLYGGLMMSYKLMKDSNNYFINKSYNKVTFSHDHTRSLDIFKTYFEEWIIKHGYDLQKIKKITALIYLNMSPLHNEELDDLLFFKSIFLMDELYN